LPKAIYLDYNLQKEGKKPNGTFGRNLIQENDKK